MKKLNQFLVAIIPFAFLGLALVGPTPVFAATTVTLGTADAFAVLGGSGITNTGTTTITGDVGSFPTTSQTGFGPGADSVTITGTNHFGDGVTQGAKTALTTAYGDAESRGPATTTYTPIHDLGGETLTPGIYNDPSSFGITGTLTLDGGGDPNAVFIFQAGSTLITASSSHVSLTNSAQACNVFWQVGSSATLGTTSDFKGTILASASITDNGGSTVEGRFLASTGAVTLNNTTIAKAGCAPSLHLRKTVTNDNSGSALNTAWTLTATGASGSPTNLTGTTPVDSGVTFKADTYTLAESGGPAGYTASTYSCVTNGGGAVVSNVITLAPGDNATCTIDNDDTPPIVLPATINVVKTVINDNGRSKGIADFPLFVNGTLVVSGVTNTFSPGTYTITETVDANYTPTFSVDCDVNGQLNLAAGENKFCVITNNDIAPPTSGGGSSYYFSFVPPLIDVVKVPSPLALPAGPGPVTYTYTLKNIGTVPIAQITMVGDTCGPIVLVSGDTNADTKLDVNETWVHTCTTTLLTTHTNTVTATGWANGISAVDVASATVVVGLPIVPPLIHVTKVPTPLALPATGGGVVYTEKITNPGRVALSQVQLVDDKCDPVNYISGDVNGDSQLDPTEEWAYTCQAHLTKTTTNTAVASGRANGLTVRDFAIVTVVVAAPGFPKAGLPPQEKSTPWNTIPLAGPLMLVSASLLLVLTKRTV